MFFRVFFTFLTLILVVGCSCDSDNPNALGPSCGDDSSPRDVSPSWNLLLGSDSQLDGVRVTKKAVVEERPVIEIKGSLTRLSQVNKLYYQVDLDWLMAVCDSKILIFQKVQTWGSGSQGNLSPTIIIEGSSTRLAGAEDVAYNKTTDELFVANAATGEILVFSNLTELYGNVAPSRTIGGGDSQILRPMGLELDGDILWVADAGAQALLAFDQLESTQFGRYPYKIIRGGSTELIEPVDLAVRGDYVWAVDQARSQVLAFQVADDSTVLDATTPEIRLDGPATKIAGPVAITIREGYCWVFNAGGETLAFAKPSLHGRFQLPPDIEVRDMTGKSRTGGVFVRGLEE